MSLRSSLLAAACCAAMSPFVAAQNVTLRVQRPLAEPNGWSEMPAISADGRTVVFTTQASNISQPVAASASLMAFDLGTRQILPLTAGENGRSTWAAVSSDGRYVAFETDSTNIGSGGSNGDGADVMRLNRQTGVISRASHTDIAAEGADGPALRPAISGDGRYVVFASFATNLLDIDVLDGLTHLYERDFQTGALRMVDRLADGTPGDSEVDLLEANAMSSDGTRLVFTTAAENLANVFGGNVSDVLVRRRNAQTGAISFENVNRSVNGTLGEASSSRGSISPNGRYVTFRSAAPNILPNPSPSGIYVRDLDANILHAVVLPSGYHSCDRARVSDAGEVLMQCSPNAPATVTQLFVAPLGATSARLISRSPQGAVGDASTDNAFTISADGRVVSFESEATNLIGSDNNGVADVFVAGDASALDGLFANGFE